MKELEDGTIVKSKIKLDIWPENKPVPFGMVRTKKGTLITQARHEMLVKARANAVAAGKTGRPKSQQTLLAEKMRDILVEKTHKKVVPMLEAQIANATGITVIVARKMEFTGKGENRVEARTGEYALVTDPDEILELLNGDEEEGTVYKIVTKPPSVESFKVLMEHSVGKPKDPSKEASPTESLAVIINNIQKEGGRSSTVTVVPKQIKSRED